MVGAGMGPAPSGTRNGPRLDGPLEERHATGDEALQVAPLTARNFLHELVSELPNSIMTLEDAARGEHHDVPSAIALEVAIEIAVSRETEMVVQNLLRGPAFQVVHVLPL